MIFEKLPMRAESVPQPRLTINTAFGLLELDSRAPERGTGSPRPPAPPAKKSVKHTCYSVSYASTYVTASTFASRNLTLRCTVISCSSLYLRARSPAAESFASSALCRSLKREPLACELVHTLYGSPALSMTTIAASLITGSVGRPAGAQHSASKGVNQVQSLVILNPCSSFRAFQALAPDSDNPLDNLNLLWLFNRSNNIGRRPAIK